MGKQGGSFLGNVGVNLGQFLGWGHMDHLGEGEKCIDNFYWKGDMHKIKIKNLNCRS